MRYAATPLHAILRIPFWRGVNVVAKIVLTCVCVVNAAGVKTRAQEQSLKPLPVAEVLKSRQFLPRIPLSLSPDGQWIAYAVQGALRFPTPDNARYSVFGRTGAPDALVGGDIWIANLQTDESRDLTGGQATNWAPAWSPDGRYLAFVSDRSGQPQLWLWDKLSDNVRRASDDILSPGLPFERPYEWTSDSKRLVIRMCPQGLTFEGMLDMVYGPRRLGDAGPNQAPATVKVEEALPTLHSKSEVMPDFDRSEQLLVADVGVVDVEKRETRRVARRLRLVWMEVSPDGQRVAMMSYSGHTDAESHALLWELSLADLETGESTIVARNLLSGFRRILWSPSSDCVAYETAQFGHQHQITFLPSIDTGTPRNVMLPSEFEAPAMGSTSWLWDDKGEILYLITQRELWKIDKKATSVKSVAEISGHTLLDLVAARDNVRLWQPSGGDSAIVITREDGTLEEGFYRVELKTGQVAKISQEPISISVGLKEIEATRDQKMLAYLAETAQHPKEIKIVGQDMRPCRHAIVPNLTLSKYEMGASHLIRWKSLDGRDLQGAVILPVEYKAGARYPLIVYVYGGSSLSSSINIWGGDKSIFNMQVLATRGYAILFPDAPLGLGEPMADLAKTVLPGVLKAIDLGIADPERVGIVGQSYGGYSALALLEESKLFRTGISISGMFDLSNSYAKPGFGVGIAWVEGGQGGMGGPLWEHRDRFIENSPLFYFDRVQAPVLLIHGDADETVPVMESRIAFESLRRLGKEVVLAEYAGEGHAPSRWTYANQIDFCDRIIAWLDTHVKAVSNSGAQPSQKASRR